MKTTNFERLGYNEGGALVPVKKEDDSENITRQHESIEENNEETIIEKKSIDKSYSNSSKSSKSEFAYMNPSFLYLAIHSKI